MVQSVQHSMLFKGIRTTICVALSRRGAEMLIKAGMFVIYCCCLLLFDMNVCCCVVVNGLLVSDIVVEQSKEAPRRAEEGKDIHDMMSAT